MLPKMQLTGLPGDPPGMRYPVACMVEAVLPATAASSAKWAGDSHGGGHDGGGRHEAEGVLLRTTVFGPAGALACWHEGPADVATGEAYAAVRKPPVWCSG